MKAYEIDCATKSGNPCTEREQHITRVGAKRVGGTKHRDWSVADVRRKIKNGDRFFTMDTRGRAADVERYTCGCGRKTIRTRPDAVTTNNLDNLPAC
jgi:hypothetical protein